MHRIRLVGPWEMVGIDRSEAPVRVKLPCEWCELPGQPDGPIRLIRSFHQPTGLTPSDCVAVVCPFRVQAAVLDGTDLPIERVNGTSRLDVTPHLSGFHRLEICIDPPATTEEAVVLEIRSSEDS